MSFFKGSKQNKTFKPRKHLVSGSRQEKLWQKAAQTLGSGNLRQAVVLPEGEDEDEWIAVNIVDFFNQINMLYGTIMEFCTPQACPIMSAGPKYEYHWADGVPFPKSFKQSYAKVIMKRLFRIYAHIYYQHFKDIEALKEEAHLNTSFKHFILFVQEFRLVDPKELQPLHNLIERYTSAN